MKKILLIGAFDRDNFGDFLLYIVTREFLKPHKVVPAGFSFFDARDYIDDFVLPFSVLLEQEEWDAIWIVGGEIGGVDNRVATSLILPGISVEYIDSLPAGPKESIIRAVTPNPDFGVGYVPDLSKFPKNKDTPIFFNSVGIAGALDLQDSDRYRVVEVLKAAKVLAVRDQKSRESCHELGVHAPILAPDIVQTLPLVTELDKSPMGSEKYVLFQASQELMKQWGVEKVAEILEAVSLEKGLLPVFFAAGLAPYHDGLEAYKAVAEKMRCRSHIINDRNPLVLAAYIKFAQLWIGSSLHGRIIASAYDVQRLSLTNEKTAQYARQWDDSYSYNIGLDALKESIDLQLNNAAAARKDNLRTSRELSDKVKEHMEQIMEKLK